MRLATTRRRLEHLEALAAVTVIETARAMVTMADDLDQRDKDDLTDKEHAADYRIFLRELVRELRRRGRDQEVAEGLEKLGDDTPAQEMADEALLDAWAARVGADAVSLRGNRVRRIQSHLRQVEVIDAILAKLPRAEGDRVFADLFDGGSRSSLTERVRQVAQERAAATEAGWDA